MASSTESTSVTEGGGPATRYAQDPAWAAGYMVSAAGVSGTGWISAAAGRPGAWTGAPGRRLRRDLRGLVLEFSGIAGGLHQNSAARKSVGEQPELEHGPNAAYPCGLHRPLFSGFVVLPVHRGRLGPRVCPFCAQNPLHALDSWMRGAARSLTRGLRYTPLG